jgi:hypothetical protein
MTATRISVGVMPTSPGAGLVLLVVVAGGREVVVGGRVVVVGGNVVLGGNVVVGTTAVVPGVRVVGVVAAVTVVGGTVEVVVEAKVVVGEEVVEPLVRIDCSESSPEVTSTVIPTPMNRASAATAATMAYWRLVTPPSLARREATRVAGGRG